MGTRRSISGRNTFGLYLGLLAVLVFAGALLYEFFVLLPDLQRQREAEAQRAQATATAQVRQTEVERAYAAGVAFAAAGDWTRAADEFGKAVALDPVYKDAAARLADTRSKAITERENELRRAYDTGVAYATAEEWDKAAEQFAKVIAVEPGYRDAAARLAEARAKARVQAETASRVTAAAEAKDVTHYDWVKRSPSSAPSDVGNYGIAYDRKRNVFVLFGGWGGGLRGETWEWDGRTWMKRAPPTSPSARQNPAMVYDSARGVIVLFGGKDASGHLNDTWEYDGASWRRVLANSPLAPRRESCVAYDELRRVVVLFGGYDESRDFDDTWIFDGNTWTVQQPPSSPTARRLCGLAFDEQRDKIVLFGGFSDMRETSFDDTWEWDGGNWSQLIPIDRPPARAGHALIYHGQLGLILLFGGDKGFCSTLYEDTWAWDGGNWRKLPVSSPGKHSVIASAFDPVRNVVLLFGGWTGGNGTCREASDTWEFVHR